jgi:ribose/xylose/arabinose/galactoside ABC-type transport system permease subunit
MTSPDETRRVTDKSDDVRGQTSLYARLPAGIREILPPLIGLVIIWGIVFLLAPTFRQWVAVTDILESGSVMFIIATGMTVCLIAGCLDLSVGSIFALASVVAGQLLIVGAPWWVIILGGLATGVVCGMINGIIVTKTGVPTLIATLGTLNIFRGIANMIGSGVDMSRFPAQFDLLGKGTWGPVITAVIAFAIVWFFLNKTKVGFHAYAIGGNQEVARLAGIPVNRDKVIYYCISGFMAALAAMVYTARVDFAHVNRGNGYEMWAIAGVVIGGTSMFGGVGGVSKTVIGVLLIYVLQAGLIHLHVESFWQQVAVGVVIIVAVWFDNLQRRAREKA